MWENKIKNQLCKKRNDCRVCKSTDVVKFLELGNMSLAGGFIKENEIKYEKFTPFGDFSLFGWKPGWLGTYIILSIILSFVIRKLLKVH